VSHNLLESLSLLIGYNYSLAVEFVVELWLIFRLAQRYSCFI